MFFDMKMVESKENDTIHGKKSKPIRDNDNKLVEYGEKKRLKKRKHQDETPKQ